MTSLPFQMSVSFSGFGISSRLSTPNTFFLTQSEYAHDIAQLEYWGGDVESPSLASGTPILVTWGRFPLMRQFYGYVNHATRINNSLVTDNVGRNAVCVTAVGASWPMKETSTTAYLNMTSTQIIEQIAAQFNLDANVTPHPMLWGTKQQGGLSYWQFCVELAQEIGYTFYCNGIQLVAIPRTTDPQQLTNLVAAYDYRTDPGKLPVFNPVLGANNPTGGTLRARQMASVDPRTGQVIFGAVSGSNTATVLGTTQEVPPFLQTENMTVDDITHLNAKLQGVAQFNQLYITAAAHGVGDARISQGHLISVQHANGSQNGLWLVTKAEHLMTPYNYTMNMELGRDSLGSLPIATVPLTQLPPKAVLMNDQTWAVA